MREWWLSDAERERKRRARILAAARAAMAGGFGALGVYLSHVARDRALVIVVPLGFALAFGLWLDRELRRLIDPKDTLRR